MHPRAHGAGRGLTPIALSTCMLHWPCSPTINKIHLERSTDGRLFALLGTVDCSLCWGRQGTTESYSTFHKAGGRISPLPQQLQQPRPNGHCFPLGLRCLTRASSITHGVPHKAAEHPNRASEGLASLYILEKKTAYRKPPGRVEHTGFSQVGQLSPGS